MGIILGALAGAGGQLADYADKGIAQDQALQRMQTQGDIDTQRQEALEQFKVQLADEQRGQMVGRLQGAAGNIADQQMAPIVAQEQAGITDPSSWTPDQQAAVDQSNALTRQGIVQQAMTDGSAGLATGDIPPEKAMENTSRMQINQVKMQSLLDRASDRNQTLQDIASVKSDAMRYGYELRLQAAQERALTGKIDTATGRMLITSEDANIKASTNQMQMLQRELQDYVSNGRPSMVNGPDGTKIPNPRISEIQQQVEGLRSDIKVSQSNKQAFLRSMGIITGGGAGSSAGSGASSGGAPSPGANGAPYPDGTKLTDSSGKSYIVQNGQPVPLQ
jgi:hypothetical protein